MLTQSHKHYIGWSHSLERTILEGKVPVRRSRPRIRWIQDINETLNMSTTEVGNLVRHRTGFRLAVQDLHMMMMNTTRHVRHVDPVTQRNMETQSLIQNIKQEPDYEADGDSANKVLDPYGCIKQEQDSWTATYMETQSLIPSGEVKEEPDYEVQTVKNETNGKEESYMFLVTKNASASSTSLDEISFLYCEKCQLKFEGGCPEHGAVTYLDNSEECQGEDYSQDSSPQVQVVDNKDRQVLWREKVEQSKICEAHCDDAGLLPNGGYITESDEMFSVCEMNAELCVADTSGGLQSNVEIKTHQKICNTGKHFSCVFGVGLVDTTAITTHKRTHTGENPYKCDECGLGFTRQSDLKRHMRTHTGEKPYKCDVCGLGITRQSDLKRHKRTHTGEKQYKCDVCGFRITRQCDLKTHMRTHTGEKPYKCDVCGLGFTWLSQLKLHKLTHTGEKPYKCDLCGLGFAWQGKLMIHQRTHTGEKPYKCDVCALGFTRQGQLKSHKLIHTGEKPYKCDVCGLGFSRQNDQKRHTRTHTGEKPFKCDVCGLGFSRQSDLKIHKRTHTGEKPYKCAECGKGFAQNGSLMKHNKTHTEALQM